MNREGLKQLVRRYGNLISLAEEQSHRGFERSEREAINASVETLTKIFQAIDDNYQEDKVININFEQSGYSEEKVRRTDK